ncbi:alpha/beta hydrolase [Isobaculum melis]|nr:alpha/beta hydrolase [Isobaculum melis]
MTRKYDKQLLNEIVEKQTTATVDGVEVLFKPIPDCDIKGAMDPRLYKEMKKIAFLTRFMPKSMMSMKMDMKSLPKLRKMFNSVDSTPIIESGVEKVEDFVTAADGTKLPIYAFKSEKTLPNAPILYFIHGGGFFGGSTDVVTDALKLIVANTGIIAFSMDYRLAPEYPYPTSHEDCYTGLKWVAENASRFGGDAQNIFVAGDSAGGNLTLYCTNKSLEEGLNLVKGQLILYPTVNMGGVDDEHVRFTKDKFDVYQKQARAINLSLDMLSGATDGLGTYLGTQELMTKYLTPYMDVSDQMPPTFVTVGEHDFLKVETLAYARKLVLAGVDTETIVYKGLGHAYIDRIGYLPQSEDCAIEMGRFILKHRS